MVLVLGSLVLGGCGARQSDAVQELVGTEWMLTSLNGEGPIEDTEISLYFEPEFLGGKMTCNGYGGTPDCGKYSAGANGVLRWPECCFCVTVQLCSEPPGVMEQEAAYIEALRSVSTYRVVDSRLELDNAAGETILILARKTDK
jgi:heat shock protein HslJ